MYQIDDTDRFNNGITEEIPEHLENDHRGTNLLRKLHSSRNIGLFYYPSTNLLLPLRIAKSILVICGHYSSEPYPF